MQGNGQGFLATHSRAMELTDNITYMELIDNYILTFKENQSIKNVVYQLVKDNLIDKKALRNKCIVKDFDIALKQNTFTMRIIYDNLCYKYNLSLRMIQDITTHR